MANVKRVLVFDSDLSARRGLVRLLRAADYDARGYADADEFLGALDSDVASCEEVNCVVLDVGTPELPADELWAVFNERCPHLPVIIVTTHDDRETRKKAEELNAVGFFRKPVDGIALLDAIDWAVRSHSTNGNQQRT